LLRQALIPRLRGVHICVPERRHPEYQLSEVVLLTTISERCRSKRQEEFVN
jgi:hypothetical protein